jgi:hypothetical protein
VSDTPVIGSDWFPTVCEIAKTSLPTDRLIDGGSLLPLSQPVQYFDQLPQYRLLIVDKLFLHVPLLRNQFGVDWPSLYFHRKRFFAQQDIERKASHSLLLKLDRAVRFRRVAARLQLAAVELKVGSRRKPVKEVRKQLIAPPVPITLLCLILRAAFDRKA